MENMELYNRGRNVPQDAQKTIEAGRLKGMTDINPMWRIKVLTEMFGPCGLGWKTEIKNKWLDEGANGEITANMEVSLYIRPGMTGEWSDGIPGIGGSKYVSQERNGMYTDDEAYKKAYTDAISVACKALGIGANVYYSKDATKYTKTQQEALKQQQNGSQKYATKYGEVVSMIKGSRFTLQQVSEWVKKKYGSDIPVNDLTDDQFAQLRSCLQKAVQNET